MARRRNGRAIRVGVVGLKRGMSFANSVRLAGMELVALCDTREEPLLAVYNQEMRRLYQAGEIGEMQCGEGDFNRAAAAKGRNSAPGLDHWRNHIPATYYCTHSLAPIMHITDTRPLSVNALCIPYSREQQKEHVRRGDCASVTLCRMDNEAVVALIGTGLHGHRYWFRIHGTRGLMENLRTGDRDMLRVVHEPWAVKQGKAAEEIYLPEFPFESELAKKTGHGGADFFTSYYFAEAIRRDEQPYLDVYRALDMALVGIQAYRSALAQGAPAEVPDFRKEGVRKKYAKDGWSPFPEDRRPGQPYPSVKGKITPTKEALAHARKIWHEMGYEGE